MLVDCLASVVSVCVCECKQAVSENEMGSDPPQEKRSAFPRFYFIGDDDLLEILGQATNPNVIQSHLKKLFAGQSQSTPHHNSG